jgi:NADP-dependent aldehyde dehydrogenase
VGEIDAAARAADRGFEPYAALPPERRAEFLRAIAQQTMALGDRLLGRAAAETALPPTRLENERARTAGQILLFAEVIEGDRPRPIDRALPTANPSRAPTSGGCSFRSDRSWFSAFQLRAPERGRRHHLGARRRIPGRRRHPAHPGTSSFRHGDPHGSAEAGMPEGVFSMVRGAAGGRSRFDALHPLAAFTGR